MKKVILSLLSVILLTFNSYAADMRIALVVKG